MKDILEIKRRHDRHVQKRKDKEAGSKVASATTAKVEGKTATIKI